MPYIPVVSTAMYTSPVVTNAATSAKPSIRNMDVLGGRDTPRPALPEFIMAAISLFQPVSIIQGIVMLPTVAALAAVEPEISPIRALARTEI